MINVEWKKKPQNDAPFVALYNMCAVTFVLPNEMADVSIAGLQWFILIPTRGLTSQLYPVPNPIYIKKKKGKILNKNHQPAAILRIKREAAVCLSF